MTCKTANLLTFRPFWSHNPIVLRGDVFDENRMPAGCDLPHLSDIERHSSKVPVQETPIFLRGMDWSSGACDETKTICGIRYGVGEVGDLGGSYQPNSGQCHSR